jgi:hypothetical protein
VISGLWLRICGHTAFFFIVIPRPRSDHRLRQQNAAALLEK